MRLKAGRGLTIPVSWSEVVAEVVHPLGFAVASQIPAQLALRKQPREFPFGAAILTRPARTTRIYIEPSQLELGGERHCFRRLRGRMICPCRSLCTLHRIRMTWWREPELGQQKKAARQKPIDRANLRRQPDARSTNAAIAYAIISENTRYVPQSRFPANVAR